jgi:hypothetical protein
METVFLNFYIFALALVFALLEIQIEGAHGWAANLPTWRSKKQFFGKPLTGYHLSIFILTLLIFHFPYIFGLTFTINNELRLVSLLLIFIVLWDFLWFVLNPNYPLKNFKKEFISWHKKWFLLAPADYYYGIAFSLLVLIPLYFIEGSPNIFSWWLQNILLFSLSTTILIAITHYVLKINRWKR